MKKNFGAKPYLYPMPVLIVASYGEDGVPDAMNAAWGAIADTDKISLTLSAEHKTVKNILSRRAFTVSMATAEQVVACDYVGVVSGNKVPDKVARAGFHTQKSAFVDAPLIDELPMALECVMESYDERRNDSSAGSSTCARTSKFWAKTARLTFRNFLPLPTTPSITII